jgi:hypothetical protein
MSKETMLFILNKQEVYMKSCLENFRRCMGEINYISSARIKALEQDLEEINKLKEELKKENE